MAKQKPQAPANLNEATGAAPDVHVTPASQTVTPESLGGISNKDFMKGLDAAVARDAAATQPASDPAALPSQPLQTPQQPQAPTQPKQPEPKEPEQPKTEQKPRRSSKLAEGLKGLSGEPSKHETPTEETPSTEEIPEYKPGQTKSEEWKAVHEAKNAAIKRALAAEEQAKKARAEAEQQYQKQLAEMRDEREKALQELERLHVERSPRFAKEYQQRENQILGKLHQVVPPSELDRVKQLMQAPQTEERVRELEGVMENLSKLKQSEFVNIYNQYNQLTDERQTKIQQSIEEWRNDQQNQALEADRRRHEIEQIIAAEESRYKQGLAQTEDEDFNKAVMSAVEQAKEMFHKDADNKELVDVAFKSAMFQPLSDVIVKLSDRIAELESGLNGTDPNLGQDGGGQDLAGDPRKEIEANHGDMGKTLMDRARRAGVLQGDFVR